MDDAANKLRMQAHLKKIGEEETAREEATNAFRIYKKQSDIIKKDGFIPVMKYPDPRYLTPSEKRKYDILEDLIYQDMLPIKNPEIVAFMGKLKDEEAETDKHFLTYKSNLRKLNEAIEHVHGVSFVNEPHGSRRILGIW